jgi:hypothetical protein
MRRREQRRQRAALERAHDRGPLTPRGIHDRQHVIHLLLEGRHAGDRVREAGAAPIEGEHAREAGHPIDEGLDRGLLGENLELADPGGHIDQIDGAFPNRRVGDVEVATLGVLRLMPHASVESTGA